MNLVRIGAAASAADAYRLPWDIAKDLIAAAADDSDDADCCELNGKLVPRGISKLYATLGVLHGPRG